MNKTHANRGSAAQRRDDAKEGQPLTVEQYQALRRAEEAENSAHLKALREASDAHNRMIRAGDRKTIKESGEGSDLAYENRKSL